MGWFLVLVGGIIIVIFLLIWYWLSPTNRWFTFVKEGTAKIVVRGDAFEKALIQWNGHTFDDGWNVIEDGKEKNGKIYMEPWHIFGGLRYYGFYPIKDIYGYWFKWSGVTENGEIVNHPREYLDYSILKDDVYWMKVEQAEDKNLLPLDLELILTIRIINPRKAHFNVQNWLETVINRSKPAVRDVITNDKYANWIKGRKRCAMKSSRS